MFDAISISDLHLGSNCCLAKDLNTFLDSLELKTKKLVLNGDVFNSLNFRKLKKEHWEVLSKIRNLADKIEVIWIAGNHDGAADIVSNLLGIKVFDEYVLESGNKKILFLHGHIFDNFITDRPFLTWIADSIYHFLQKLDKRQAIAKWAKQKSKQYLRCKEKIKKDALQYLQKVKADIVCVGHTHNMEEDYPYYNSGCWTEYKGSYLVIDNGKVNLKYHL